MFHILPQLWVTLRGCPLLVQGGSPCTLGGQGALTGHQGRRGSSLGPSGFLPSAHRDWPLDGRPGGHKEHTGNMEQSWRSHQIHVSLEEGSEGKSASVSLAVTQTLQAPHWATCHIQFSVSACMPYPSPWERLPDGMASGKTPVLGGQ